MNAETRARVFEPFYTTKPRGKGTGLGLATVYGIVRQSGGSVTVSSEPDEGAEFEILFPVVEGRQEESEEHAASSDSLGGSETVLLVEDERPVRELLSHALREKGYRVLEACHGLEALKLYQAQPSQVDIVVTDLVMPRMGGVELIERLTQSSRKLKVLYMSGHMDDQTVQQVMAQPDSQFLQKPFKPAVLVSRVRETLDSAPA
jgi:CheY-like chemotaxis protein